MTTFAIRSTVSGVELGSYEGETARESLEAMAKDAGYSDYDAACEAAPVDFGELAVDEIA
jgi:hypothetical protein